MPQRKRNNVKLRPEPFTSGYPRSSPLQGIACFTTSVAQFRRRDKPCLWQTKIVHLMKTLKIDVLGLQETRINRDCLEQHDDYVFYFSSSITHETRSHAERVRREQQDLVVKELSEIELYNLDAEKLGVGLVMHKRWNNSKQNLQQINNRLLMVTFDTSPIRLNVIVAYAPHAGKTQQEKDLCYREIQQTYNTLPPHEINLPLGDFNSRLMEVLPHESSFIGPHIFRHQHSSLDELSPPQQYNRIPTLQLWTLGLQSRLKSFSPSEMWLLRTFRPPSIHTALPN